jgi:hypothetical protein
MTVGCATNTSRVFETLEVVDKQDNERAGSKAKKRCGGLGSLIQSLQMRRKLPSWPKQPPRKHTPQARRQGNASVRPDPCSLASTRNHDQTSRGGCCIKPWRLKTQWRTSLRCLGQQQSYLFYQSGPHISLCLPSSKMLVRPLDQHYPHLNWRIDDL